MLMNEEFVRCPKCKHPYFYTKEKLTLDKMHFEHKTREIQETKRIIAYHCEECDALLHTVTQHVF